MRTHAIDLADTDVVEVDGMCVTSASRTVLDLAACATFRDAVAVADAALLQDRFARRAPLVTRDELVSTWERAQPMRAHARTRSVIDFAETRAESPLESVSRVAMRRIGVPRPQLQVAHFDGEGFIGETDFAWPEFGAVAEADGDKKYVDARYREGRSADQVVLDEKRREDRIRALPRLFTRWGWQDALNESVLRSRLISVGLPTGCSWD